MTKILIVGEAYGQKEALFDHPFVGASGVELGKMLNKVGLAPGLPPHAAELDMIKFWKTLKEKNYSIAATNVFNLRPQDNNIEEFFTNDKTQYDKTYGPLKPGKFLKRELIFHLEKLWQTIEELKPNLILALGNTACWALIGETKISAIRGTIKTSLRGNYKVLPTYHPAAILRQWPLRPITLSDLEKAAKESETKTIARIERYVIIEPTLFEIEEWLTRPADFYAIDIETMWASQISMIGFARNPFDAIVIPFVDKSKPNYNYWDLSNEEIKAWKFVDKLLSSPTPKIFQNGVFDLSHLLKMGFRPKMCKNDTMLLHHSLYPEMLKGLGFLGSIYSEEISWKQMAKKGDNLKRDE